MFLGVGLAAGGEGAGSARVARANGSVAGARPALLRALYPLRWLRALRRIGEFSICEMHR